MGYTPITPSRGSNLDKTYLEDLFIPEVIGQEVEQKLINKLAMDDFTEIDTTLVGQAGDKVKLPSFKYIGDASDVAEGEAIPIARLQAQTREATIKKIGKGVPVTDEAVLSGYGNPIGEATTQLALAIKSKLDEDTIALLAGANGVPAGMTVGNGSKELDDTLISKALVKYGEDTEGQMICPINPEQLESLRNNNFYIPASEIAADIRVKGSLGSIHGVQFVIRNRIKPKQNGTIENYIIKERPIKYYLKRGVMIETERDASKQITTIYASQLGNPFLYDESKIVKIVAKAPSVTPSI